jgi:hypothetical protein
MPDADVLALLLAVSVAYTCATALGFGANVISVALGAQLLPVDRLLPVILPTSLALSAWIAWRQRAHVAGALLGRELLPWALLGFPLGMLVFEGAETGVLKLLLGAVVAGLALLGLLARGPAGGGRRPLPPAATRSLYVGGGFVQGLFASGGPLIVYALSRRGLDKGAFRATLCLLWVLLNTALLVSYGLHGRLDEESLRLTAWVSPAMVVGLAVGHRLHAGLRVEAFRRAVDAGLLVSGLVLLARGA